MVFEKCDGCGNAIDLNETSHKDDIYFIGFKSKVAGYSWTRVFLKWLRFQSSVEETYWCQDCVDVDGTV